LAGCSEEAVAAAEVMISELVTNAVLYGSGPIDVELHREGDILKVSVTDRGTGRPLLRNPQASDPHGRGLLVVQSLADDWGIDEHDSGKTVWFTLPCRELEP
jgi:anti-sigma regulatory factor (Ser/Thr protein kinase)